ncbi:hypothetical protein BDZ89DRAFT_1062835 [Hymenopellis radicata]|nr:hypothetical protein BDZ89DRAFT_1062835 [Hymenopellis radicata]
MLIYELIWLCLASVAVASSAFMDQSFFFDYVPNSQTVPVPVTSQCETINISWERTSGSTGPNPSAPYFLQIYTSAFVFPFIVEAGSSLSFDWQVPFGPGTIYQMCMFDKNGYTGGCQAMYTMIANTTVNEPTCANASFPLGPLDIDAQVEDGPLSMYGWVNQCTDIAITPKNGTPPYILTIAPSSHPPLNITMNDMSTVNWTVDLSWASPFFISVVDSEFNRWSYGPLHSGGNGPTGCLALGDIPASSGVSSGAAAGIGLGGATAGALLGIAVAWFIFRRREHSRLSQSSSMDHFHSNNSFGHTPRMPMESLSSNATSMSHQYHVEPFRMPGDAPSLTPNDMGGGSTSPTAGRGSVYVVHHDGGRAPVTVYHQDGTEVVELPPRYANAEENMSRRPGTSQSDITGSGSDTINSSSDPPRSAVTQNAADFLNQPRQTGPAPKKASPLRPNRRPPSGP